MKSAPVYLEQATSEFGRRRFLKILGVMALGAGAVYVSGNSILSLLFGGSRKTSPSLESGFSLEDYGGAVVSGGPPKDGIPSIDRPRFVPPNEADQFLSSQDRVFGIVRGEYVRAYPQRILVWHEIVNDRFGDEMVSVTYCPLTGSAIGFKGESGLDGRPLTFGTTGNLVNSNLLMYDRQTDSNWPQILGRAINGPLKGQILEHVPLVWTTWSRWKTEHSDTVVLSPKTGFFRAYGDDPYGTYQDAGRLKNYYTDNSVYFPVLARDSRFHNKKIVLGIKAGENYLAIPRDEVKPKVIVSGEVGQEPVVAIYDSNLDTVRVFSRRLEGRTLDFRLENQKIVDSQSGSDWSPSGASLSGSFAGSQLRSVAWFDVMWFAWSAFFVNTEVLIP